MTNEDNLHRYREILAARSGTLIPSKSYATMNELMHQLVLEGDRLLAEEATTLKMSPSPVVKKAIQTAIDSGVKNPYVQAREQVLKEMDAARRKEILAMESSEQINNRHYEEFLSAVRKLGDKLSN